MGSLEGSLTVFPLHSKPLKQCWFYLPNTSGNEACSRHPWLNCISLWLIDPLIYKANFNGLHTSTPPSPVPSHSLNMTQKPEQWDQNGNQVRSRLQLSRDFHVPRSETLAAHAFPPLWPGFFFFNQLPSPFLSSLLFSLCVRVPTCTLVLEHRPACTCFPSAWGTPFQQTVYYVLTHVHCEHNPESCPDRPLSLSFFSIACSSP